MSQKTTSKKTFPAISLIEFGDLARGLTAADAMIKKAPIAMLKSGTVSGGKYFVLIGGTTASVETSFREGLLVGGGGVLDSLLLPVVHPQVYDAILGIRRPCDADSLGIIETGTVAATIVAADSGIKGSAANLLSLRLADGYGGKGYSLFQGKVEDVTAAIEIGLQSIQSRAVATSSSIIPAIHPDLARELASSLRFDDAPERFLAGGETEDETG